ncbi:MAG: hypothetical protein IKI33_03470, partial [Eubacterium sp.]|nr:hypothetical protein [Eubacterium sp.]
GGIRGGPASDPRLVYFSVTTEVSWRLMSNTLGLGGAAVGVATKNIGLWIPIGLAIGVGLGCAMGHNSDNNGDDETGGQK